MKNKIRIYELAKELDLKSKFVVEFLHDSVLMWRTI